MKGLIQEDLSINIIKDLVKINSCNPDGNEMDMVNKITGYFKTSVKKTIVDHGNNRGSLVIEIPGENKCEEIAFVGHIDTVPVHDEDLWEHNPFEAKIVNGYLYGRGAADMKGGVTAMISTARYLIDNSITPKNTVKFCFTADEESGGTGVTALREKGYFDNVSKIIIAEPSNEKIGLCEKGALWLKVTVVGKASHASKPHLGINAIDGFLTYVNKLKSIIDFTVVDEYLGKSTFAITTINAGVKTNITPDRAVGSIDIRTVPGIDHKKIIDHINMAINEMHSEGFKGEIKVEVENNRDAVSTLKSNEFVEEIATCMKSLGHNVDYKGINFYTDASQIIPYKNVPFVILGPGEEEMAHQRNEKVKVDSIIKIANIYTSYLINL